MTSYQDRKEHLSLRLNSNSIPIIVFEALYNLKEKQATNKEMEVYEEKHN